MVDFISLNPTLIWLSLGVLLITLEIFSGTFYLVLVGTCALVTSLMSYFISTNTPIQLVFFGVISSASIFLLRGRFKQKGNALSAPDEENIVFITESIAPHTEGIVHYQGVPWTAVNQSSEELKPKTQAIVVKTQGNKLILKSKTK